MKINLNNAYMMADLALIISIGLFVNTIPNKLKLQLVTEIFILGSLIIVVLIIRYYLGKWRDMVNDFQSYKRDFPEKVFTYNTGKTIYTNLPLWLTQIEQFYNKEQIKKLIKFSAIPTTYIQILKEKGLV